MPRIESPTLLIPQDQKNRTATVEVKCSIVFADNELCLMQQCAKGAWYQLLCTLYKLNATGVGTFTPIPSEVYLELIDLPQAQPVQSEAVTFPPRTMASARLNVNWGLPPAGIDNIVARLTLTNLFSQSWVAEAYSNVVTDYFLP